MEDNTFLKRREKSEIVSVVPTKRWPLAVCQAWVQIASLEMPLCRSI